LYSDKSDVALRDDRNIKLRRTGASVVADGYEWSPRRPETVGLNNCPTFRVLVLSSVSSNLYGSYRCVRSETRPIGSLSTF
jgi:hypothetical protein